VPVQVIHNVVHHGVGDARELRCPHCTKRLAGVRVEEVELAGCGGCGGIWVDNASAQRVVAAPRAIFEDLARRAATNAHGRVVRSQRPSCPVCDAILDAATVKTIQLDVCADHGTWFDAWELANLTRALTGKPPRRPQAQEGDVACVVCKTTIAASSANLGESGPTCEACWRAHTSRLVGAADARHGAAAAGAAGAGALLLGLALAIAQASDTDR
jgi:Zn-finger nucleic acid-binding protein